ncbi:hypothetical protein WDW89_24675 [Deltaproteobacteria bacterium TL4]
MSKKSITGIVGPADWDSKGNVVTIALFAPDEKKYLIKNTPKGRKLFKHVGQQVAVIPKKNERYFENLQIEVSKFCLEEIQL